MDLFWERSLRTATQLTRAIFHCALQVEAIDADADDNGLVNYVIQHQQEGVRSGKASKTGRNVRLGPVHNLTAKNGDPDVPFSIHPRSGHVIVTDTPLTKKSYSLFVEASDQPANPSERRHSLAVVQVKCFEILLVANFRLTGSIQRLLNGFFSDVVVVVLSK